MPSFVCRHPTCNVYLPARGYCPAHAADAKTNHPGKFYDQHVRDPAAVKFYHSAEWKRAREIKLGETPWCERCVSAAAAHVHHIKPLRECAPAERIAQENLLSLCLPCHNQTEAEIRAAGSD